MSSSALEGRKARFAELQRLKASGDVDEDREGHVAQLAGENDVAAVVAAENADREAIETVRQVFAETQPSRAAAGEKAQLPSGEWITK